MQSRFINQPLSMFTRAAVIMITLFVMVSLTVSTAFAFETPASSPSAASSPGKSWTNISYTFASDNLYAVAKKSNKQLKLSKFNIPGIPGHSTIDGIAVTVEGLTAGLQADVQLSYNGGSNYTSALTTALSSSETINTLGGPTNTWGRTWSAGDFTNSKFMMKLITSGATGTGIAISVDQVQVKVYYTPPPTTITIAPVSGPYAGTAPMSATLTLTADGSPIPSKTIKFYIGGTGIDTNGDCTGTLVGTAATQADGTATLASASLSGLNAGDYPYGACASFAGDANYQPTSLSGDLNIIGTATTLIAAPATGMYGDTVNLSATLTLTSGGTGINNKFVDFYLFGNFLASAKTNSSGIATLSNISLIGYDAGVSNDISVSFAGDQSLDPATGNGQITISQRPITVTAVANTKTYDGTTSSSGVPSLTSGSLVTGDVAGFLQTFDTKDVGTGKTLTPSGAVDDGNSGLNYAVTFVPVNSGVINTALLTITADNQSLFVGGTDPVYTASYNGFVAGETSAVLDTAPTCTVSVAHTAVGTYPIICSGAADNDYSFSYVNGTLTVSYAHINVDINGTQQGTGYDLAVGASDRRSFALNNGPVKVYSPNNAKLIAAERVVYKVNNIGTSFSEMMGLPNKQLDTTYWLPWYNNLELDTQLRFGNVTTNQTATVRIWIGGQEISGCNPTNVSYPYVLGPGQSLRVSCPVSNGPVEIQSNVPIVAAERVVYKVDNTNTSFTEMMALPNSQLNTSYWLPWYNDLDLDTQLRFGNVTANQTATVHVWIGGHEMTTGCQPSNVPYPYVLGPGQSLRVSCPNVSNGPVKIESNVPIVAAERVVYKVGNLNTSFTEMMALPNTQLSTTYWLPWYNNLDLDTQLRFGNVSPDQTATVRIYINGKEMTSGCTVNGQVSNSPYTLAGGASLRVSCSGISSGPVKVVSSIPIVAAERVVYTVNSTHVSFSEMMGLPNSQLDTAYWLPWYNNFDLDTQLRFGVPGVP